ncbi:hypothetical protein [Nannocystis pusilla]|uniref:hypothetical protein n=1 Tax=Nannocystis pusilla TaxID=889268 RepID=UPI003B820E0D
MAWLLVAGCARLGGREPVRGEVDPQVTAAVAARVPESCRAAVAAAMTAGEQLAGQCATTQSRAAQEVLAATRQRSFGIVDRTTVRLASMGLVLSQAHLCRRWPLRAPGQASLDVGAARLAGCNVRRYVGPLAVTVRASDGTSLPVMTVRSDQDGQAEVSFAEVDALLRARGRGGSARSRRCWSDATAGRRTSTCRSCGRSWPSGTRPGSDAAAGRRRCSPSSTPTTRRPPGCARGRSRRR